MRLRLFFVSSFTFFVFAACGGKVVLDSSSGAGTGGAGGSAACAAYCGAMQEAACSGMPPDCQTTCLSAFALGNCQSELTASLECAAVAIAQSGCTDPMASPSCQQSLSALSACESGMGTGGTVGTAGFGAGG